MLVDRVVDWYKAEVVAAGAKARIKGRGSSTRQAAGGGGVDGDGVGGSGEGTAAAAAAAAFDVEQADRVASVWALLAKTGEGDAQKCLKKVTGLG